MKFLELSLSNFRLFKYDQEIKFDYKPNKPLTIIRAENRIGKTTLLTALQWCFYGDVALENAKQALTDGDLLVSFDSLKGAKPGDVIKTQVAVRFENDGREYIAKRVRETVRDEKEANSRQAGPDSFTVLAVEPAGAKTVPNPTILIDKMLPENLRELFLFDGDRINTFMKADHEEAVQKAVSDMLEFELFAEAQRHLKSILSEYRNELRGVASGEAKLLREQLSEIESEIEKTTSEITRLEKEKIAEGHIEEQLVSEIAGEPGDAGSIQQQINSLREQIRRLEDTDSKLCVELGRQFGQGSYLTISKLVEEARQLLLQKKEAGEIPKRIGENLIKERLELGICICGRPLKPGEEAHNHLKQELDRQKDRAAFDELATEVLYYLNSFSRKNIEDLSNQLDDILMQRTNYQQTIIALSKQITELEQKLSEIDVEAIIRKRAALTDIRDRMQHIMMDIAGNTQKVSAYQEKQSELTRKLRQAEKRDERNRNLRIRERITEECLKALTLTYQNVREIEREKISERTKDNFFRMNIRKDEFETVEVTPAFRLQVIAPGGYIANAVLSGAQRRALSLAFLFALMQVSERNAPVVVDTPLGMTSGPMRRSITKSMMESTEQLILLLTRSEIREVEDILESGAATQYTLTCSKDYPLEIVNPPKLGGSYTEVCNCDINSSCPICERRPTIAVDSAAESEDT